jgi:hypothetical protein
MVVPSNLPPPPPAGVPITPERPKHKPLVKHSRRRSDVPDWMTGRSLKLIAAVVVTILMMAVERLV